MLDVKGINIGIKDGKIRLDKRNANKRRKKLEKEVKV